MLTEFFVYQFYPFRGAKLHFFHQSRTIFLQKSGCQQARYAQNIKFLDLNQSLTAIRRAVSDQFH